MEFEFNQPHTLCIIGAKGSGKSYITNFLITSPQMGIFQQYKKVFIFSPTFQNDPSFSFQLPDDQIFPTVDDEYLEYIIALKETDPYENYFILFDDVVSQKAMRSSKVLQNLILNSRHYGLVSEDTGNQFGISICCTSQHLHSLPPYLRENLNWILMFNTNNGKAVKILHEEFFASYPFQEFLKIFRYCTGEKHSFLLTNGIDHFKKFNRLKINMSCNDIKDASKAEKEEEKFEESCEASECDSI